jgi:hypothetical protein
MGISDTSTMYNYESKNLLCEIRFFNRNKNKGGIFLL